MNAKTRGKMWQNSPPAPRIDEPSSSLHRVPERLRRSNQVLCSRCVNIKYGAHLHDDLAARAGWQISK
jgi:hypothetical protein